MNQIIKMYTDTEGNMYLSDGVTMWDVTDSTASIKEETETIAKGDADKLTVPTYTFDEMREMREHPFTIYNEFVMEKAKKDKTSIYDI